MDGYTDVAETWWKILIARNFESAEAAAGALFSHIGRAASLQNATRRPHRMPRSAAGKAAREQKLTAAGAWKRGHTGGRGRGKFRAQGRGGRGGRGGPRDEWHGAGARAEAESRDDGVDLDTAAVPYDEDEDDDPVAAVGAGEAYQALLASLAGSGDDPADDEFADALAANDESEEEDTDGDASEEEYTVGNASKEGNVPVDHAPDEGGEGDDEARVASGRSAGGSEDEAAADEGDEEDLLESSSSEDEADGDGLATGHSRGKRKETSRDDAFDPLEAHLARRVDGAVAKRLETLAPKFRAFSASGRGAKKSKGNDLASSSAGLAASRGAHHRRGRWEFDRSAFEDARHGGDAAEAEKREDAFRDVVAGVAAAPRDLPTKVKERWNAVIDPAAFEAREARARRSLERVTRARPGKAAVEAEKARAASAAAAEPAAAYASGRQAEFHELLRAYADVTLSDRAPLGFAEPPDFEPSGGNAASASRGSARPGTAPRGACGDEIMDAYLLHAVSHVTRTRRRVTKNNEALLRRAKAEEAARDLKKRAEREGRRTRASTGPKSIPEPDSDSAPSARAAADAAADAAARRAVGKRNRVMVQDDVPRDQGFARATVLILVPMRNIAGRVVRRLLELCPAAHGRADAVSKLERFADDFGAGDSDEEEAAATERRRKKNLWVPEDHSAMFRGNTDDHFRLGIKVTKASVRLYVDFFGSDILIASPLGAYASRRASRRAKDASFFPFYFRVFFLRSVVLPAGDETFTTLKQSYRLPCGRTSCSLLARGVRTTRARRETRDARRENPD